MQDEPFGSWNPFQSCGVWPNNKTSSERLVAYDAEAAWRCFHRREILREDGLSYCPQCKDHKRARKKMDIWRVPEVLVVSSETDRQS